MNAWQSQSLSSSNQDARLALLASSSYTTVILTAGHFFVVLPNGLTSLEVISSGIFAILSFWISLGFWTNILGLREYLRTKDSLAKPKTATPKKSITLPDQLKSELDHTRTAILFPVYNESPKEVFARLHAIESSLRLQGAAEEFDFFVLSDTTDPEIALREERIWSDYVEKYFPTSKVYYRRRVENTERKAGNISEFCDRWGNDYELMVVLDADSVMSGSTLVEMVRRMREDNAIGILQVPPRPINRDSLYARLQQFGAALYSPLCLLGFRSWVCDHGNYWGHNAIIRVDAFKRHCRLPHLPGSKPLGGEILSHDFVEAALMVRHGWKVLIAHDLGGSYEECPTTLEDALQRDQRWCQGNLQHSQIVIAENIAPLSRIHFTMGIMSFLSSPLWMLYLIITLFSWSPGSLSIGSSQIDTSILAGFLFAGTLTMLLAPKFLSMLVAISQPDSQNRFGSPVQITSSVVLETLFSVLMAPIMAYYHSRFVIATLMGKKVSWNAQRRNESVVTMLDAFKAHYDVMAFGILLAVGTFLFRPELLGWMTPILVGPLAIIPIASMLSRQSIGKELQEMGLLLIPEEQPDFTLLKPAKSFLEETRANRTFDSQADLFELTLKDPKQSNVHVNIATRTGCVREISDELCEESCTEHVIRGEYHSISPDQRRQVIADPSVFSRLSQVAQSTQHVEPTN